ncbi:MAG: DMT family transporter [Caldilinea sp.]|uniref:DMT family transporter n=1 Tax=Caldilinea sp. TaxID=2293560 RepID=UPI002C4851E4|nr:DMT family transporter [Caldilinea sp.]HRA68090.1 DMT family transporter [Caldilinea sp.]
MTTKIMAKTNDNVRGVSFLLLALLTISLQTVAVKWISGSYPVLQIVILRSLVALPFTLLLYRYEGKRGLPTTQRPRLEYARGLFLFLSYTTFMMGLAALPLAEISAIRNSGPLMITLLSVVILGETVGPRRWMALLVGFAGVLLIVRPGSASFNLGSIFVLISVLLYALTVMVTRKLHTTDSSATMSYYSTLVYLVGASIVAPLVILAGDMPGAHPSIAFLFRPWAMPTPVDFAIMAGLGIVWAAWMYFLARAYSLAQASVAAPFEYLGLPIDVMWGFLIWGEVPTWMTWAGAFLTIASGVYILYRERK